MKETAQNWFILGSLTSYDYEPLASTPPRMPGTHPQYFCILLGGTSTGISPNIITYFRNSRPILVALRSLSLKPISFGYKTPPSWQNSAGRRRLTGGNIGSGMPPAGRRWAA